MGTCRVVIEAEPQSGVRNMALDEALLQAAIDRTECTVRWYRWQTATISLGYFQDAATAAANPELAGLPMVRRLSGGGAILHHHEWTYSCALPAGHPLAAVPGRLYDLVHQQAISALAERGVSARLRGEAVAGREGAFLCFGRGDPRDVVLNGQKIIGSAQRRRRGAVLQHGSLLLRNSQFAPQLPGLFDLAGDVDVDEEFIRILGEGIGRRLGSIVLAAQHPEAVAEHATNLESRYENMARATPRTNR